MRNNKGFTLIELMVVILIVAILAAVLAPMLSGRINESKWTEGKAGAGTIATAIRAYCAENEAAPADMDGDFSAVGIESGDLAGKYFNATCYSVSGASYDAATGTISYTITIDPSTGNAGAPSGSYTLDAAGTFSKVAAGG